MYKIFKALSDENRIKVLQCLCENSCKCIDCKCEDCGMNPKDFQKKLNISFPTISHHIEKLRESGLISCEKKGQKLFCKINSKKFEELNDFISNFSVVKTAQLAN